MISFSLNLAMIFFCIVLIVIQELNNCPRLSIVQLQNYMWLLAFIIYLSSYFSFYPLHSNIYIYSVCYLFFFNLASLRKKVNVNELFFNDHQNISKQINSPKIEAKIILSSVICWIISIPIFIKTFPILFGSGSLSLGMNLLRYQTYGANPIFSTKEMMLISYILRPVFMVSIIYLAEQISIKIIKKRIIFISLINSFILVLLTAGRALLFNLIIYVIVSIIISNGLNLDKIFMKYKSYLIPAFFVFSIVVFISSQRINRNNGPFAEFLIYYFSSLPYLSQLIKFNLIPETYFFGRATFSFLVDPVLLVFKTFFHSQDLPMASQIISQLSNQVLHVSDVIVTNATSSTLLSFILDGGAIAVSISASIIGFFTSSYENKLQNELSPVVFGRYLFLAVGIINSIQNYSFGNITTLMTWIMIYLLLK